jgi:hypothetical protein
MGQNEGEETSKLLKYVPFLSSSFSRPPIAWFAVDGHMAFGTKTSQDQFSLAEL